MASASGLGKRCRPRWVPVGTIDALPRCIRHELVMRTSDGDLKLIAFLLPNPYLVDDAPPSFRSRRDARDGTSVPGHLVITAMPRPALTRA